MSVVLTHLQIDKRLLGMVRLCVEKIDAEPHLLERVSANIARIADPRIREQWTGCLATPWPQLRAALLDESEAGDQFRQNVPFGGLLSNRERYVFFKQRQS